MFNNIKITKAAVEYLADQYGDDEEQAEEHVITIISMCQLSAAPSPSVEQLQNRVSELESALTEAVELIQQWHSMDTEGFLTKEEHVTMWKIYEEKSPEMQRINIALAKGKS